MPVSWGGESASGLGWLPQLVLSCSHLFVLAEQGTSLANSWRAQPQPQHAPTVHSCRGTNWEEEEKGVSCRNRGWRLRGGCGGSWEVELASPWDGGAMGSLGWI